MATKNTPEAPPGGDPTPGPPQTPPQQDAGGTFVNAGGTALVLISPPGGTVKPGRVITLPYTPGHRDLHPATAAQIKASADAEAAEAEAARLAAEQDVATAGQEA